MRVRISVWTKLMEQEAKNETRLRDEYWSEKENRITNITSITSKRKKTNLS